MGERRRKTVNVSLFNFEYFCSTVRITGIVTIDVDIPLDDGVVGAGGSAPSDHLFTVYDVGGQRSERKKWGAVFDIADAVVSHQTRLRTHSI